jgi:hypothetical protein
MRRTPKGKDLRETDREIVMTIQHNIPLKIWSTEACSNAYAQLKTLLGAESKCTVVKSVP